jgi:hypothetical protein
VWFVSRMNLSASVMDRFTVGVTSLTQVASSPLGKVRWAVMGIANKSLSSASSVLAFS